MAASVALGPDAPREQRRELQGRLRACVAGASIMWFLLNVHSMTDSLVGGREGGNRRAAGCGGSGGGWGEAGWESGTESLEGWGPGEVRGRGGWTGAHVAQRTGER